MKSMLAPEINNIVNRTFTYDLVGNRKTDTANGTTSTSRNIIKENDNNIFYSDEDGLGRLAQKSSKTEDKHDLFKYRSDGRMIEFTRYENGLQTRNVKYYQDALGRRVAKDFDIGGSQWTNSFSHLVNQDKILIAADGNGDQTLYVDSLGIDEHLGRVSSNGALAFVTDHLGTVTNDEAVSEKDVTGAFGENLGSDLLLSSSSAPVRYGFTGRELDAETQNCYFYRARTYCTDFGRYTSEDPRGKISQHKNEYDYSANNPILFVDPFGENPITGAIIGGAVGFISGVTIATTTKSDLEGSDLFFAASTDIISGTIGGAVSGAAVFTNTAVGFAATSFFSILTANSLFEARKDFQTRERLRREFPEGFINTEGERVGNICGE